MIKSWDYLNEYKKKRKSFLTGLDKVFKSGKLFFGDELSKFENYFIKKNGSKYGIGVGSGTDALLIALKALNVGFGDEVITVANTAIPTVSSIISSGASVKFVDIGEDYLIDPSKIEKSISKKTKAIIVVHLYGQACSMDKITKIVKKHNLKLIEDCAQAQGATFNKKKVGNFGSFGCFSFYPTKILGAYGDAGFITTNDKKLFKKVRRIRFYGIEELNRKNKWNLKYFANEHGINSRLNEVQASILNIKLKTVEQDIGKRRKIASIYNKAFKKLDIITPKENTKCKHVYHLYVVAHKKRDQILKKLKKKNIYLNIHYPYPLHKMTAYKTSISRKSDRLILTEKFAKRVFSLPLYPSIEFAKIKKIINEINKILDKYT